MKYIVKTNFAQKKADFIEFQQLRAKAETAERAMFRARGRISLICNMDTYKAFSGACLNYLEDKDKNVHLECCPMFFVEPVSSGCKIQNCDYAKKNKLYHEAVANAEKCRDNVNNFWANKFAHVK